MEFKKNTREQNQKLFLIFFEKNPVAAVDYFSKEISQFIPTNHYFIKYIQKI